MAEIDSRFVKHGLWTNLEEGDIMGKTITTDTRTGTIVIALMAILSTVGTSHLWNLVVFAFHQVQATGGTADGYFRQQQAILRTLPPPSSLMADSIKLWWSWKKRNNGVLLRSTIQLLLASLCALGFLATSIFSAFVVDTSDLEVLVSSPSCGLINTTIPVNMFRIQLAAVGALSTPYAKDCYRNQTILPARCKAFIRPSIPFTTEKAPCPFSSEFCTRSDTDNSSAIALDSGLVDLNDGFGLNLPEKDRVYYRRQSTCAVLPLEGHVTIMNASLLPWGVYNRPALLGEEALLLHYGDRPTLGEWKNATFIDSMMTTNVSRTLSMKGYAYSAGEEAKGFQNYYEPSPGLRVKDADVSVISLMNSIDWFYPVHDPWLLALKERTILDKITGKNLTLYNSDNPGGRALGCVVRHQFCINTGSGQDCSKLDSLSAVIPSEAWPGSKASAVQLAAIGLLVEASNGFGMAQNLDVLAMDTVQAGGFGFMPIPDDQWIAEVKAMEAFVWASAQVYAADYALGPGVRSPELVDYVVPGDKQLCASQKMRKAGGFVNIHVFGMAFVIAAALFFAILDIALLKFLIFLSGFRKAMNPRLDRWIQDGVLQLQRRAYEAEGQGTWSHLHNDVPLTEAKESLEELAIQTLKRRTTDMTLVSTYTLPQSPKTFADSPKSVSKKDVLWRERSVE